MSDSNGYIYDKDGIKLDVVKEIKEVKRGRIKEYVDAVPTAVYTEEMCIRDRLKGPPSFSSLTSQSPRPLESLSRLPNQPSSSTSISTPRPEARRAISRILSDRKSTRLNSSHSAKSRMPSSA